MMFVYCSAMAKLKTRYVCQACGSEHHRWQGQCADCAEWNTLVEEAAAPTVFSAKHDLRSGGRAVELVALDAVVALPDRMQTGIAEFDRAIGGGIVPGSAMLIGGDPGIGKSTLLLQAAARLAAAGRESSMCRARKRPTRCGCARIRLGLGDAPVQLAAATSVRDILTTLGQGEPPAMLVIDSIQTMHSDLIEGAPGTVSQVRASAQELIRFAKERGHRAGAGRPRHQGRHASPGRACSSIWSTRCSASRASAAISIASCARPRTASAAPTRSACSRWRAAGLIEVPNPSALFLTQRGEAVSGTSVFPALEGTRPVLVEIQALIVRLASGATPRRAVVGWDSGRLAMILAVLEARCGLNFSTAEVYLNVAGGYRLSDPAADLAVAAALVSALSRAAGAAGRGGDRRDRAVGRSPAGCACRAAPQGIGQAGFRARLGAGRDRRAERHRTDALRKASGVGRPDPGAVNSAGWNTDAWS